MRRDGLEGVGRAVAERAARGREDQLLDGPDRLADEALEAGRELVQQNLEALQVPLEDLAAALALMARGDSPLLLDEREPPAGFDSRPERGRGIDAERSGRHANHRPDRRPDRAADRRPQAFQGGAPGPETGFVRYRIEVGAMHGVQHGNIMGAIANEAGLGARQIGRIRIHDECSHVELPAGMSPEMLKHLEQVWVAGRQLQIREDSGDDLPPRAAAAGPAPGRAGKPGRPRDAGPKGRKRAFETSNGPGGYAAHGSRSSGGKFGPAASGDRPRPQRGEESSPTGPRRQRPAGEASGKPTGKPSRKTFAGKATDPAAGKPTPGKFSGKKPHAKAEDKGPGTPADAGRSRRAAAAAAEGGAQPPKRPKLKRPPRTRAERKEFLAGRKKR